MNRARCNRLMFITGTDTDVGKTLFTALLLQNLRRAGCPALAIKPFSSGARSDARLFRAIQGSELTLDEVNPFHFAQPLAPLAAAGDRQPVTIRVVVDHIRRMAERCSVLLVEGVGGLLVPLGTDYTVLDLIRALPAEVIVVSRNRLGTINHTLLTVRVLRQSMRRSRQRIQVVLMQSRSPDQSAQSNPGLLAKLLDPVPLHQVPFLPAERGQARTVMRAEARLRGLLDKVLTR